ncbi:MAG: HPt (histidine-containing phosphotransfer) domain-containing protein [Arenicella sp.]|jgi:HPt (histidine-containing phosphotransfer) domain-containing protein
MDNADKLQLLKDQYRLSLIDKSVLISELLLMLSIESSNLTDNAGTGDKAYIEIHQCLHKLAGSSGMYGYSAIAELSRAAMQSSQRNDAQLLVEQLNELRDLLQQHALA